MERRVREKEIERDGKNGTRKGKGKRKRKEKETEVRK